MIRLCTQTSPESDVMKVTFFFPRWYLSFPIGIPEKFAASTSEVQRIDDSFCLEIAV